ncbi:thiolase family protein [Sulfurospirillum arcachonense]|uniref:thiolase family protein n=1 Tax=Sulfurospirillum arcachonense TaxID=57666 RepID=UPI00046A32B3|nr:thiolase family protein [Sulfurospirillum arcachonense]
MRKERIAIIDGLRSPIAKANEKFKNMQVDTLASIVIRELVLKSGLSHDEFDEVIVGNVAQPPHASNVAKVIAARSGFSKSTPAMTVNRNCASGMEAITSSALRLWQDEGEIYLACGAESMSNIPFFYNQGYKEFLFGLMSSKTLIQKISILKEFKPSFLKPVIGLVSGLTDPISGMIMGKTAEILAKDFHISREEQDAFSLLSHQKAKKARENGIFTDEILPIIYDDKKGLMLDYDDGVRDTLTIESLKKLKPFFDRRSGTITVGNSSQVSDGASACILMKESTAKKRELKPIGYLKDFSYVGLEAQRMGLGPIFATQKLLKKRRMKLSDFDLIEINEAFAAQVIANIKAFASKEFCAKHFNMRNAMGEIDMDKLNVNGGAVAMGHPVGMSGNRLVVHILKELKRRNLQKGLATLCIGGGQGAALILEVE